MTAMCVFGGAADGDGVCIEHGETACVVTYSEAENCLQPAPVAPEDALTSN